ncbi:uncharacterized protein LOC129715847 isoform X6 [Leucoraja erinacea]|uniref:uncharacterized protein LOC129715847 isoform X6 n=1 Tax=Leucoraja erinaceus TaxID=7782 RepID=UPI0024540352|nr:uncharacterized protein LOC129715847 isoform X6 [Leucoraja erinacea]
MDNNEKTGGSAPNIPHMAGNQTPGPRHQPRLSPGSAAVCDSSTSPDGTCPYPGASSASGGVTCLYVSRSSSRSRLTDESHDCNEDDEMLPLVAQSDSDDSDTPSNVCHSVSQIKKHPLERFDTMMPVLDSDEVCSTSGSETAICPMPEEEDGTSIVPQLDNSVKSDTSNQRSRLQDSNVDDSDLSQDMSEEFLLSQDSLNFIPPPTYRRRVRTKARRRASLPSAKSRIPTFSGSRRTTAQDIEQYVTGPSVKHAQVRFVPETSGVQVFPNILNLKTVGGASCKMEKEHKPTVSKKTGPMGRRSMSDVQSPAPRPAMRKPIPNVANGDSPKQLGPDASCKQRKVHKLNVSKNTAAMGRRLMSGVQSPAPRPAMQQPITNVPNVSSAPDLPFCLNTPSPAAVTCPSDIGSSTDQPCSADASCRQRKVCELNVSKNTAPMRRRLMSGVQSPAPRPAMRQPITNVPNVSSVFVVPFCLHKPPPAAGTCPTDIGSSTYQPCSAGASSRQRKVHKLTVNKNTAPMRERLMSGVECPAPRPAMCQPITNVPNVSSALAVPNYLHKPSPAAGTCLTDIGSSTDQLCSAAPRPAMRQPITNVPNVSSASDLPFCLHTPSLAARTSPSEIGSSTDQLCSADDSLQSLGSAAPPLHVRITPHQAQLSQCAGVLAPRPFSGQRKSSLRRPAGRSAAIPFSRHQKSSMRRPAGQRARRRNLKRRGSSMIQLPGIRVSRPECRTAGRSAPIQFSRQQKSSLRRPAGKSAPIPFSGQQKSSLNLPAAGRSAAIPFSGQQKSSLNLPAAGRSASILFSGQQKSSLRRPAAGTSAAIPFSRHQKSSMRRRAGQRARRRNLKRRGSSVLQHPGIRVSRTECRTGQRARRRNLKRRGSSMLQLPGIRVSRPECRTSTVDRPTLPNEGGSKTKAASEDDTSLRVIGEIAFQLDRRILLYVFHTGIRMYGYRVLNISQITQKCKHPAEQDAMNHRYRELIQNLGNFGYSIQKHARFAEDIVNTFGFLKEKPLCPTLLTTYNDVQYLQKIIHENAPHNLVLDLMVLLNCLADMSRKDGKPLFIW